MAASYRLMGVLNVTPDSFSDGGRFLDAEAAIAHGRELVEQGAEILDIGGESTRPGAAPVDAQQEISRVAPVLAGLAGVGAQLSIDTSKLTVAEVALREGATLLNDVTAFRADPRLAGLVADSGADCCLMHMLGEPRTMQREPLYEDVVSEVKAFLEQRLGFALAEGIEEQRIMLDPGIGFGKTAQHNLELLRRLGELVAIGRPLVIGTSRKTFLGRIVAAAREETPIEQVVPAPPEARLPGTLASNVLAYERGASVFRVHDVAAVRDALAVAAATLGERWRGSSPETATS
jgi:dihydropteroate synthase